MRVENIGTSRNIPDSPQRPGLAEGDVLVAEVTDIKGDKVFLKNQEGGAVFTAKLLSDIGVAVGDFVETVVDEASGGRYVLRVVDISRQAPFASEAEMAADTQTMNQAARTQALLGTLAMLKNNPGADPKAAAFLSRHGLTGTAENIIAMSQMAKGPSPVTALLTQVIEMLGTSQRASEPTPPALPTAETAPQNPQTAATVIQNGSNPSTPPAGQVQTQTGHVQGQAASVQGEALPPDTVQAETPQTNISAGGSVAVRADANSSQVSPDQTTASVMGEQTAVQSASGGKTPSASVNLNHDTDGMQTGISATDGQNMKNAQTAPQTPASSGTVLTDGDGQSKIVPQPSMNPDIQMIEKAATQPPADETIAATPPKQNAEARSAAEAKPVVAFERETAQSSVKINQKDEPIVQKALDMFVRMDEAEKLAVHLKKAVQEMPEQLKELKLLADDADSTVREAISSKLEQIDKQTSLMSEVKRFDCYQIPLQTAAQQQTTAELFVYRYRGGKKAVDPDNILILLGLDTQYMGRVETLVKTSAKSLNVEFNLEDMRLADEMRADAAQLKGAVQQAGYTLSNISVKQLAARTTVLNAEERFEKEADGSSGKLDIRV